MGRRRGQKLVQKNKKSRAKRGTRQNNRFRLIACIVQCRTLETVSTFSEAELRAGKCSALTSTNLCAVRCAPYTT